MTGCNVLYVPRSEWKKGATGQSFIRKEIATYRIGTLVVEHETISSTVYMSLSIFHNLVMSCFFIEIK